MPTSVRLDSETEALIRRLARVAGRTKSWVIREAVTAYAADAPRARTAYEALAPFVGAGGTGQRTLSEQTGEMFGDVVRQKARARDPR